MKNLILAIFILTGLAACKSDPDLSQDRNIQLLQDSGSYTNNVLSDTNNIIKADVNSQPVAEKPQTKTIVKTIIIEKPAAKTRVVPQLSPEPTNIPPVVASSPVSTPASGSRSETKRNDSASASGVDNTSTASTSGEKEQKKTSMSKATQGAIIGGVAGAVGGAVISKKKGLGAVVGGLAGAAGGYIIGKKMDKKDNKFLIN